MAHVIILEQAGEQHTQLEAALSQKGYRVARVNIGDDLTQDLRLGYADAAVLDARPLRQDDLTDVKSLIRRQSSIPVILLGGPGAWQQTHEIIMPQQSRSQDAQRMVGKLLVALDSVRLG